MMNYEIFKEVVKEKFMDFLPEQYQNMKLAVNPTEKVNHTVQSMRWILEFVLNGSYKERRKGDCEK